MTTLRPLQHKTLLFLALLVALPLIFAQHDEDDADQPKSKPIIANAANFQIINVENNKFRDKQASQRMEDVIL